MLCGRGFILWRMWHGTRRNVSPLRNKCWQTRNKMPVNPEVSPPPSKLYRRTAGKGADKKLKPSGLTELSEIFKQEVKQLNAHIQSVIIHQCGAEAVFIALRPASSVVTQMLSSTEQEQEKKLIVK